MVNPRSCQTDRRTQADFPLLILWQVSGTAEFLALYTQRCSVSWERCFDGLCQIVRVKAEGPRLALVKDTATFAYQVESVGPAGVSRFDPIVEAIYERGKLDAQLAHTCAGNVGALNLVLRTAEEDVVANIGPHLPHISGMRFKNVNGVESDLVAILIGQLVQGGNLPPKRRSRIAAED